jgi:hypothetical protein
MLAAATTSTAAATIDRRTLAGRRRFGLAVRVAARLRTRPAIRPVAGLASVSARAAGRVGWSVACGPERGADRGPPRGPAGPVWGPLFGPEPGAACGPLRVLVARLTAAELPPVARSPAGAAQIPVDRPSAMARHVCVDVTSAAGSLTASTG